MNNKSRVKIPTNTSILKYKAKYYRYIALAIFIYFFNTSCNQKEQKMRAIEPTEINLNLSDIELAHSKMTTTEIWDDLIVISSASIKNKQEFEEWITKKIDHLNKKSQKPSPKQLYDLSSILLAQEDLIAAEHLAEIILRQYKQAEYQIAQGPAAATLAYKYNFLRYTDSVETYNNIIKSAMELDSLEWLEVTYYSNLGNIASNKGEKFDALVNYRQALKLIEVEDKKNFVSLTQNIASIYLEIEFHEKSLEYLKRGIDKQENINELPISFLNTYAVTLQNLEFYDEAKAIYEAILRKNGNKTNTGISAMVNSNLGNLHRRKKDFKNAMQFLNVSDSICSALNIEIGFLINHVNRSELFIEIGDFDSSLKELKKGEKYLATYSQPELKKEFHRLMFITLDSIGNKDLANHHFRLFTVSKDAFLGDLTKSAITEQELLFERQRNIEKTAAIQVELQKEVKEKYFIAFLLTLSIFVLSVIIAALYRRNVNSKKKAEKEKIELKNELERRSKKLLTDTLFKINEENIKASILCDLETILRSMPISEKQKFLKLKYRLRSQLKSSTINEFETRFNGVYDEYYTKLLNNAPNLTANELKVCALIKLNISTKEIAELTNRTEGTIENLRIQIRKKLNLESKTNLQKFLLKI